MKTHLVALLALGLSIGPLDACGQQRRLGPGDRLPEIRLPSLASEGTLVLSRTNGALAFKDAEGRVSRPRAAVVFFIRY
ncbi:MAG: hypothetical protein KY475_00385 [Planctomycetes bacterium]|nr:hypothetical protein [Planctomycetota bacterium]